MNKIHSMTCSSYEENCYVLSNKNSLEAILIDPGCLPGKEEQGVKDFLSEQALKPLAILLTHAHFDHIFGAKALQDFYGIPIYMHPAEKSSLEYNEKMKALFPEICNDFISTPVEDGQLLSIGPFNFEVIACPGHSAGSVAYLDREDRVLFSGDTLFAGTIGRSDLPGGDYDLLMDSLLSRIMVLDGDIELLPGHGPSSNIAREAENNPFLQPFNEPEEGDWSELEPINISGCK